MMNKWMTGLVMSLMALAPMSARAFDFLLEPMVGGQFSGDLKILSDQQIGSSDYSSLIYGGRLGLEFDSLSLGGEYLGDTNVNVKVDANNAWGSQATTVNMSNTNYGAFLAYELMEPLHLRLIGTFYINSQAHIVHTNSGTVDGDITENGYGYKAEVSARLSRYVSLGIGYYYLVYTKIRDNQTGITSTEVPVGTADAVMGILSIPLNL
jgi:hypothetical protein